MKLQGKCALVTGGAVRVGRCIVEALVVEGARVVVHFNRSSEEADRLVRQITEGGGEAVALGADLSDPAAVTALAADAEAVYGGVDVLVNNASIFPQERLGEVDDEVWERTFAVNLRAPFFLTQALGAAMRRRGAGVIVNLADLAGMQVWAGYHVHSLSKAGLIHLTRVSARALAPEVRVVAIAPGTVLPPDDLAEEEIEKLARRAPLRRIGSPEDVASAVLYLIRADFVTGEVLVVDGGRQVS